MSELAGFLGGLALPAVDQIGSVVRSLDAGIEQMSALGVGPWYRVPSKPGDVEIYGKTQSITMCIGVAMLGAVQLELTEPVEGNSIHQEFLDTKGEGLHHLGFVVADFDERVTAMTAQGLQILHGRREEGKLVVAYMDTSKSAGILIELLKPTMRITRMFERVKQLANQPA